MSNAHFDEKAVERLKSLKERVQRLNEKKTRNTINKENAEKSLKEDELEATEKFGTCDIVKLEEIKLQRQEKVSKYLDTMEQNVSDIENALSKLEGV